MLCKVFRFKNSQLLEFISIQATLNTLNAAKKANVGHFVLLSAFCVKKPLLQVNSLGHICKPMYMCTYMQSLFVHPCTYARILSSNKNSWAYSHRDKRITETIKFRPLSHCLNCTLTRHFLSFLCVEHDSFRMRNLSLRVNL